jgi:oligopeptide transport system permease protein
VPDHLSRNWAALNHGKTNAAWRKNKTMAENYDIPVPKKSFLSLQVDPKMFEKATDDEKRQQDVMAESTTFFKDGMRRLMKNPLAVMSMIILAVVILILIFAPIVVPYDYDEIITVEGVRDKGAANLAPFEYSEKEQSYMEQYGVSIFPHIFGTDELCRDYFIRVVYGTRVSLMVGVFASIMVLIIGTIYGAISGYMGGKVDMVMMRIVDIIYSLPDLLIIILLSVVFKETLDFSKVPIIGKLGTNMVSMFIVFGLLYWVSMARLVRGEILGIKQNEYVLAAKSMGASSARIIRKHILPNCLSVIIIMTAQEIPTAIFTESYLSFLGLGVALPMPSLGSLANAARSGMQSTPWKLVFPAVAIILVVLAFNLIGDAMRDAFDPKLKQ